MIKVFDKSKEYETYSAGGINSGEVCYVKEDKSAHFRTNNIDGSDTTYDMSEGSVAKLTTITITENDTYDTTGTDYDGFSEVTVNVPIPEGYIVPTGAKSITENGTDIDVAQYATVNVSVSAPAPSYNWQTVSTAYPHPYVGGPDLYLEMNAGTTYIFKSSAGDVKMYLGQTDSDGEGDVDLDDEFYSIGRMVPNKEYYLTATNDKVNTDSEHVYDQGKAYIFFGLNGGSSTIQYAVVS